MTKEIALEAADNPIIDLLIVPIIGKAQQIGQAIFTIVEIR
jgi:hypothetical protein